MSITLDVASTDVANVRVGPSPLAELMATLHVLTSTDHHPESSQLIQNVTSHLDQSVRNSIWSFAPLWSRLRCRLFFPLEGTPDASWDVELKRIRQLNIDDFADIAAEGILGLGRKADAPNPRDKQQQFLSSCARRSSERYELAARLVADASTFREELLEFLHTCWGAFMEDIWYQTYPSLARSSFLVRETLQQGVSAALQSLSPTATTLSGGRVRFDKLDTATVTVANRPLYLVPSRHTWPHLTIKHNFALPAVIFYPIVEASDHLSMRELIYRLSALNSVLRLEICRHLLGEPITTSELGIRLGIAESQVSRALTQLRSSGLVVSERIDGQLRHRVEIATVKKLGIDVLMTITR